ncbi:hypothetical protein R83H12_01399 [Fibrobacteria bacterium R8-3-H12]
MEIGRAIGAEYITQGTIGKFGSKLTISVELYESMSGKLLSSIVFESDNIESLLSAIRSEAKPLFQSILNSRKQAAPAVEVSQPAISPPEQTVPVTETPKPKAMPANKDKKQKMLPSGEIWAI